MRRCTRVVRANRRFVPPYGSGASLYVRPLLLGVSAEVGVKPSHDYLFLVLVTPVGPYYKGGFTPVRLIVEEQIDRAAPGGVGDAKCGGNYAAGMRATLPVKEKGYAEVLYLDCREKKYLDESGSSNFYAIIGKTFATPASPSILPSITNMSVQQIAKDMDARRSSSGRCRWTSFHASTRPAASGTAAVITPVEAITYRGTDYVYAKDGKAGPITTELYKRLDRHPVGRGGGSLRLDRDHLGDMRRAASRMARSPGGCPSLWAPACGVFGVTHKIPIARPAVGPSRAPTSSRTCRRT